MQNIPVQVNSEVGRLRSIVLHKPFAELDNLIPDNMHRLLFDDIPDARLAAEEYDVYIDILKNAGVEIFFIEDLVAEALDHSKLHQSFVRDFLADHNFEDEKELEYLTQFFLDIKDSHEMVLKLIAGLRKEELDAQGLKLFKDFGGEEELLVVDPLPNLYFTRDPFTFIGDTVSMNSMYAQARRPECRLSRFFFHHHPDFADKIQIHNDPDAQEQIDSTIEGGDILILNEQTIAIGVSQRTRKEAIYELAKSYFNKGATRDLQQVLAFEIPSKRAYMHLDTVFTQLDEDCFVVHPGIEGVLTVHELKYQNGELKQKDLEGTLEEILSFYMGKEKIRLIKCGGDSPVDAEREQWNDGANTLAIAPGEVIVYGRNNVSNRLMEEAGLKLYKLPISELARGRGGPHCMSMPMFRDLM